MQSGIWVPKEARRGPSIISREEVKGEGNQGRDVVTWLMEKYLAGPEERVGGLKENGPQREWHY